jgi:hypothetical protein
MPGAGPSAPKLLCQNSKRTGYAEIKAGQLWAMPQHSCKTLCPSLTDLIVVEMEVHQR